MSPIWTLLLVSVCAVAGQYSRDFDSPLPPRPVIQGAIPLGQRRPSGLRSGGARRLQEEDVEARPPPLRTRRPGQGGPLRAPRIQGAIPAPIPQSIPQAQPLLVRDDPPPQPLPPRPVVEDLEELLHIEDVNPTTIQPQVKVTPQLPEPSPSFRPAGVRSQEDFPVPTRQQFRNSVADEEPTFNAKPIEQPVARPRPILGEQRVRPEPRFRPEQRPSRPVEQRPQQPQRQQYNRQQQVVSRPEKEEYEKPIPQPKRGRKPTVQVLKKYREDNADGSITWGFENDDGTFKEETIGIDCVTRGKYGYFDPEGVRREFTYTSGIPCDKDKDRDPEGAQQGDKGYIDYSNNRYVLPNGDSVDINSMVKNRARKPSLRN